MVCNTTSLGTDPLTGATRARQGARGFTFVELMFACTLAVILTGVLLGFTLYSGRSILAMSNYLELDAQSRTALDTMVQQMRRSAAVTSFTSNSIALIDYDGKPLTFTYDKTKKELYRIKDDSKKGVKSTRLLRGCDGLTFNLFAGDPIDGSWKLTPTTKTNECKAIFVSWNCSRKFLDTKVNTESMTSATVVLRNR